MTNGNNSETMDGLVKKLLEDGGVVMHFTPDKLVELTKSFTSGGKKGVTGGAGDDAMVATEADGGCGCGLLCGCG